MVVRATCVCIREEKLLVIKQSFEDMETFWSLPGGKPLEGETLTSALVREVREETGIDVRPRRLLYVTERITSQKHVTQVIIEADYRGGILGAELSLTPTETVLDHKFIPLSELEAYGISAVFADKVRSGFPDAGSYVESIKSIGL